MTVATPDQASQPAHARSNKAETLSLGDLRLAADLTMTQVEERSGVRRAAISEIERALRLPRRHELVSLAGVYGVDPDDFDVVVEYRIATDDVPGAGQRGCG